MSFSLGANQAIYQKTEVFDTPGNHTWTHPLSGQNIEVFIELYGGGGGSQVTSGVANTGGNTIWDTAGVATTAVGGAGANADNITLGGLNGQGLYDTNGANYGNNAGDGGWTNGSNHYGASVVGDGISGNVGEVKRFNFIANSDINLTVGAGGTGNAGNGNAGAVIVRYNITTTQTPVVVNQQRRDWEHFGEIAWRTAANTAHQAITLNTITPLTLDTEVLDTGNKVTVDGSNLFTLQAGTYEFDVDFTVLNSAGGGSCFVRLYNVSDSSIERSMSFVQDASSGVYQRNFAGHLNLSTAKQFRLEFFYGDGVKGIGRSTDSVTVTDQTDRTKFQFKWRP